MTRDDIIRMAKEAGHPFLTEVSVEEFVGMVPPWLERFAAFVAAEKEQQMIRNGWRQCAEGQRTTQFCALLEAAVKAEREACAKVCEEMTPTDVNGVCPVAAAIRARGDK